MEDCVPCGQEARAVSHQSLANCTHVSGSKEGSSISNSFAPTEAHIYYIPVFLTLFLTGFISSFKGVPHIREEVGVDDHTHHIHVCPHKGSTACLYFELYPWNGHTISFQKTPDATRSRCSQCALVRFLLGTRRVCPLPFNVVYDSLFPCSFPSSLHSSFLTAFGSTCHIGFLSDKTFLVQ